MPIQHFERLQFKTEHETSVSFGSGVEVGQHFYCQIGSFQVHGQVLMTSWDVIAILLGGSATIAIRNPQTIPNWSFQD